MSAVLQAALLLASVAIDPGAGVIVGVQGRVTVEHPPTAPRIAVLGMRLEATDVVVVEQGGEASVYLKGGGVVRLHDATRFSLPKAAETPSQAKIARGAIAQLESGLWVLNDPGGSLLVSPMRGDEGFGTSEEPFPVSPRYEALTTPAAVFAWNGGPPRVRVVVAKNREVIWRSAPAVAPLEAGKSLPLVAGEVYSWWLEPESGSAPLTAGIPFRVAAADVIERTRVLEQELQGLDPATRDTLLVAHYAGAGNWTRVLELAKRLPNGDARTRAYAAALHGLRMDERKAAAANP